MAATSVVRSSVTVDIPFRLYVLLPTLACFYVALVEPLLWRALADPTAAQSFGSDGSLSNRLAWPALAAASIALTIRCWRELSFSLPSSVICLILYMLLAGASVFWATEPDISFRRYVATVLILLSVSVPTLLSNRSETIVRDLFYLFALITLLNLVYFLTRPPTVIGHAGYMPHKNMMGQVEALAVIFALHEVSRPGVRRLLGGVVALVAFILLFASQSKTALGLALLAPVLGLVVVAITAATRISAAIVLFYLAAGGALCFVLASHLFGWDIYDVSVVLFGDPTFTGRTTIWAFVAEMISREPILGWGYQSFWLTGPASPAVLEGPGFVAEQPHAHNGYLDTVLETGFVGLSLIVALIVTTVHNSGRIAHEDPRRAWLVMSLVLFVIFHNGLESSWVRPYDAPWLVFAIMCAQNTQARRSADRVALRGRSVVPAQASGSAY